MGATSRHGTGFEDNAEFLSLILGCLPAFVVAGDRELRFSAIRGRILEELGLNETAISQVIGTPAEDVFTGPAGESIMRAARDALAGSLASLEVEWGGRWYNAHIAPLRDAAGEIVGIVAVGIDITSLQQLREQLERERQVLDDAQQLAEVGSWVVDLRTGMVQLSTQMARVLGMTPRKEPVSLSALESTFLPEERELIESEKERALRTCGSYDFDHDIRRLDGTTRHVRSRGHVDCDENRNPIRCVGTMLDMTARVEAQRSAELLAYHDALTGLPNRWLLRDRLETAIASAAREHQKVFVLFIDLDHFKRINDTLGHAYGDALLAEVGQRLHHAARSSDTVARTGGDEFVIVLTHVGDESQLESTVAKVQSVFALPFRLGDSDYTITASIGIAGYPADAGNEDDLLKDADAAMYEVKQRGRNAARRFSSTSIASSIERVKLEADVLRALRNDEFRLHYQPIVDATTLRILGVEALLRWQHPERGLLLPLEFLDAIEKAGQINAVGEWVLRESFAHVARWRAKAGIPLRLSVNVASRQLQRPSFVGTLTEALRSAGLPAAALDVELTENSIVRDVESASAVLERLRELGVGVAIDDFGTGYNSLAYVKYFPITALKIDRSFVREIGVDAFDEAISSAVAALGRTLRIRVIAEGVEQQAQLDSLRAIGCGEVQGFYLSPPLEAEEFDRRLLLETQAG